MSRSVYWSARRSVPRMTVLDALRVEGARMAFRRGARSWHSLMPFIVESPVPDSSVGVLYVDTPGLTDDQLAELRRQVQRLTVTAR